MPQKLLLIKEKIRTHSQKKKKKASKNTGSSVNKKDTALPIYKINTEKQIESLRDPALYPKENRSRLEALFLNDYDQFLRFFLNTYNHISEKRFDDFLTNWRFQTFQKNMVLKQKRNRNKKNLDENDLDKELELRWIMFLDNFENMLEGLPMELRDIATALLGPNLTMFKKMLDLDRKNKGKSRLKDSIRFTQNGTEFANY